MRNLLLTIILATVSQMALAFPYFVSLDISESPPELITASYSAPSGDYTPSPFGFNYDDLGSFEFTIELPLDSVHTSSNGLEWRIPYTLDSLAGSTSGVIFLGAFVFQGQFGVFNVRHTGPIWTFRDGGIDYTASLDGPPGYGIDDYSGVGPLTHRASLLSNVYTRTAVPEPGPLALMGFGLLGLVLMRRNASPSTKG